MASAAAAQDHKQFEKILEQLAQRNEAVELFALGATANPSADDPAQSIKVRVLDVTANALVIERPLMRPGQLRLRPDMSVEAQFLVDGTIWNFKSKIRRATVHKLNRSTSVPAIELARPRGATAAQNRRFFRLKGVGTTDKPVLLYPIPTALADKKAISPNHWHPLADVPEPNHDRPMTPGIGKPISGTLINISAGGLCLLVNPQHKETCAMGRHFWLRLDLDEETGRLWEIGKIVHIKETDNGNHRLGVRFERAFHPDHGKCVQEAICAFIAEQQRRQLQRAR